MIPKLTFKPLFLTGNEFSMIVPEGPNKSNFVLEALRIAEEKRKLPTKFLVIEMEATPVFDQGGLGADGAFALHSSLMYERSKQPARVEKVEPYYVCEHSLRCKKCNKYWPDKCECPKENEEKPLTIESPVVV